MVVRLALAAMLAAAQAFAADPAPLSASAQTQGQPLSSTAEAPLEPYHPEANRPLEDFFVVSIVSLPFTAFWSFVGSTAVVAVSKGRQHQSVSFSTPTLVSTGLIALGASVSIGLLSVSWGQGVKPKTTSPSLQSTPTF
jgi:hypothetical protein